MKRLYWDAVAFNNQRMFLTATRNGLTFISNPGRGISQIYDFYRHQRFEFKYVSSMTKTYRHAIDQYLDGSSLLGHLHFDLSGIGTANDRRVWRRVKRIPYGEVRMLAQIATSAHVSLRQTARALKFNPIPLLIPTHRVIISAEKLGHFRESLEMKSQLLEMETIINNVGD